MGEKTLAPSLSRLYDEDFAVWTGETARRLRAGQFEEIDIEHLAEEIEDMGKSPRHEVLSRARLIIVHLLKWKFQPEKRSGSWRATIRTQRIELDNLFQESPSLRRLLQSSLVRLYSDAIEEAADETGLSPGAFPAECPFTAEQILDRGFLPE